MSPCPNCPTWRPFAERESDLAKDLLEAGFGYVISNIHAIQVSHGMPQMESRYEYGEWRTDISVPAHYHISVEGTEYSVPNRLVTSRSPLGDQPR